jgi:hypothetical protein
MKNKFWKIFLHKDSFLLIAALVWLWFAVSMLVDVNYNFHNLHPHKGEVTEIDVAITRIKNKLLYKDTTRELRISLVNEPQYFTISTTNNFDDITETLVVGDTVTVYTKDKLLGIFGYGNSQHIAHLVKHPTNQMLIDFRKKQQSISSIVFLPVLATIIFLIWYIIKLRRRLWWDLGGYEKHLEMRSTQASQSTS